MIEINLIKDDVKKLEDRLADRYQALRQGQPTGVQVGSYGVPYAAFHEYGTKWSNRMPYGFWKAVRGRKQRSGSKNVMEFSGKGKDRMARIKARPFLKPALAKHKNYILKILAKAVSDEPESMERALMRIGTILEAQIVENIRRPPRTEKGARGPIANTGGLLNSIRYEILR